MTIHRAMTRTGLAVSALALLAACESMPDLDLRDVGNGFDTSEAAAAAAARPEPDERGVISYPTYQVAVARQGDTVASVAARVGLDAGTLARFNGLSADAVLRGGEVVALPGGSAAPAQTATAGSGALDVTAVASSALDRADAAGVVATPLPAPAPAPTGAEPIRHRVERGETTFTIARLYDVPVSAIAEWNGLDSQLTVREGQLLLIPQGGARAPRSALSEPVPSTPGQGTPTPLPPSAAAPLPDEDASDTVALNAPDPVPTPPAPNLTAPPAPVTTAAEPEPEPEPAPTPAPSASSGAALAYPVQGSIIRAYSAGRNEGIDIAVPAGTAVKAAGPGTVAAVTTDTNGVAIVVVKHPDNLLTVYTNLEDLSVAKDDTVAQGATLGKVRAGDPSFLHFETRRGLQSIDPATLLP